MSVTFSLDGREVAAEPGESVWQAARRHGVDIPHLCHRPAEGYRPDGNCRLCVVEIEGERALAASCVREARPGMVVRTATERVERARRVVRGLLDNGPGHAPATDRSHPAMTVALEHCVHCGLCVRACREVQGNDVIGMAGRGVWSRIVFDLEDPMGGSSCVGCGECAAACPTDAIAAAAFTPGAAERVVESVCPWCGVGCRVAYHVAGDAIIGVEGRDGPANAGRLCVKGRFGLDYVRHDERLTVPLIRREDAPKSAALPSQPLDGFREASWEEALERAAAGFRRIRAQRGPGALAGFGSAKGSNEEAYLFQKLVRTGFGTNNVDHCTRLCHASSVAALMQTVGSGAVTAPVRECANADVIVVMGANPAVNHPVAATWIKNAAARGAALVVIDPRWQPLSRHADINLSFRPGSDVALLNALMHVILDEGLHDRAFVAERTEGFEALAEHLHGFAPEAMEAVTGVPAGMVRLTARRIAGARAAMFFWGMGLAQHAHGTDNARALIALALLCGHVGRPGAGLHPLRGQNNVQGASDAGLIPMMYPDYRPVADATARAELERRWGAPLPAEPGLTVVEILAAAEAGDIAGMYIMGENPAMSDPDLAHARRGLAALEHLVVQDIFLTETAALADVVLPASAFPEKTGTFTNTDRLVQIGRQALDPPGQARQDLWIIQEMARRLGLGWADDGPAEVFADMRRCMPSLTGISWERLEREGGVVQPCAAEDVPGRLILFADAFATASGKARLVPAALTPPAEVPDEDYPLVLTTGRLLEHWHTGAMTRRAGVLAALEPAPEVYLSPALMDRHALAAGDAVTVETRRGAVTLTARPSDELPEGLIFMPFCWREAAANLLTHAALDPEARIAEVKFCAARLRRA